MKKQKHTPSLGHVRTETSTAKARNLPETTDEGSEIWTSATKTNTSMAGAGEVGDTFATNTLTAGADEVGDTFAATPCEERSQQPNDPRLDTTDVGVPSESLSWSQMVMWFASRSRTAAASDTCEEDLVPEMPLVAEQLQSREPASAASDYEEKKEESFSRQQGHQQRHVLDQQGHQQPHQHKRTLACLMVATEKQ